jgi:hypothetical protein
VGGGTGVVQREGWSEQVEDSSLQRSDKSCRVSDPR